MHSGEAGFKRLLGSISVIMQHTRATHDELSDYMDITGPGRESEDDLLTTLLAQQLQIAACNLIFAIPKPKLYTLNP